MQQLRDSATSNDMRTLAKLKLHARIQVANVKLRTANSHKCSHGLTGIDPVSVGKLKVNGMVLVIVEKLRTVARKRWRLASTLLNRCERNLGFDVWRVWVSSHDVEVV
jgi:hypothetical protein